MRKILLVALVFLSSVSQAEFYKVTISRIDSNLYKTTDNKILIKTQFCYEYATYEEAILKYDQYSYFDNKLIFDNGTSCDVKAVYSL